MNLPRPGNLFAGAAVRLAKGCLVLALATLPAAAKTPVRRGSLPPSAELWWSLKPVIRPSLPEGTSGHPIDRFLEAGFRKRGLKPAGAADPLTLLRRVHLDLTGIPPTVEEQQAFLRDAGPEAWGKVLDRLLADEQHAVRYARRWLDVLRYADADERMPAAAGIHLWRDWVIQALQEDMPYDQFVQVQLTGRRAQERTVMSATGYRTPREPRPGDQFALGFLARGAGAHPQDLAINAADTVSTAFLGMTVGCAKCHDHFYDPVSQKDYYALKALFDPLVLRKVTLASAAELLASGKAMAATEKLRAPIQKEMDELVGPWKARLYAERVRMLPPDVQAVIHKPEKQRTPAEQKVADDYFPILRIDGDKLQEVLPEEVRQKYGQLQDRLGKAGGGPGNDNAPRLPVFHAVETDPLREQEKSYVLTSGDPERPEKDREVQPGWPFAETPPDLREGRVEAFADWLTAPANPLFARVAVNRLWQWHFGEGLHRSVSDFGEAGGKPDFPELLDWLAAEFVDSGFSMKAMHRLILTSDAWRRQSQAVDPADLENQRIDPDNSTLWRFRLQRLDAETVWDSLHAATGQLDLQVGGRSFGSGEGRGQGRRRNEDPPAGQIRRGAYLIRGYSPNREVTPQFLQTFDVDDGRAPCPVRTQTVTPPQALFLMNSPEIDRAAAVLAERVTREAGPSPAEAVRLAYQIVLSRPPVESEQAAAMEFLGGSAEKLPQFAWSLFNLDEFLYVK